MPRRQRKTKSLFPVTIYDADTGADMYTLTVESYAGGAHEDDRGDGLPADVTIRLTPAPGADTRRRVALYRRVS